MKATDIRKRHRVLVKLGFRPRHARTTTRAIHYNRGGHRYRINMHGSIDRSCPHAEFDRWANSTEQTWTWPEFLAAFEMDRAAIAAVEGEKK